MPRYMPQDVFDMCVVGTVKLHMMGQEPLDQVCAELCGYYKNSYQDDLDFELEIAETSKKILEWGQSFGENHVIPTMTQLQYCLTYYGLDGTKKKKKRFFNGTFFNKAKTRNPNRSKDCVRNITVYHLGTVNGLFPPAPTGWSLASR